MLNENGATFEFLTPGALGKNDPKRYGNDAPIRADKDRYSRNIFYYWWAFLRLHMKYGGRHAAADSEKIESVYRDFGAVLDLEFGPWWEESGRWLFAAKYETESHAAPVQDLAGFGQLREGIAVFFPFDGNLKTMLDEAEEAFIKAREEFYAAKPDYLPQYALVTKNYDFTALYNEMAIYEFMKQNDDEPTYVDAFFALGKTLLLDKAPNIKAQLDESWFDDEAVNKFVHDNYETACRLVYHVARGEFPNFTQPVGPYRRKRHRGRPFSGV